MVKVKKLIIKEWVTNIEFDNTVDDMIRSLQTYKERYESQGYTNLTIEEDDNEYPNRSIYDSRLETNKEYDRRIKKEQRERAKNRRVKLEKEEREKEELVRLVRKHSASAKAILKDLEK